MCVLHLCLQVVFLLLIAVEPFCGENSLGFHSSNGRSAALFPNTGLLIDFRPGSSKLRLHVLMTGPLLAFAVWLLSPLFAAVQIDPK